jgi:hypothetical protein
MFRFAEKYNVIPLLAPAAYTSDTAILQSSYVRIDQAHALSFVVPIGNMTSDSTDTITFTVQCSTAGASNATEAAVPFRYRLSNAIDTGGWGAITSVAATGVALTAAEDNKILLIEVDPAEAVATQGQPDAKFVRLVATFAQGDGQIGVLGGVQAVLEPRYPGNAIPSAT